MIISTDEEEAFDKIQDLFIKKKKPPNKMGLQGTKRNVNKDHI